MTEFLTITKQVFEGIGRFVSLKLIPSFLLPLFGILFGFDDNVVLRALLILVVFDFITGILAAHISSQPIKSKSAVRSAFKVAVYGLLVSAGHLTDQVTPGSWFIQDAVTSFLALTELISIIENTGKMGYAIPKKLLAKLQSFRDDDTAGK